MGIYPVRCLGRVRVRQTWMAFSLSKLILRTLPLPHRRLGKASRRMEELCRRHRVETSTSHHPCFVESANDGISALARKRVSTFGPTLTFCLVALVANDIDALSRGLCDSISCLSVLSTVRTHKRVAVGSRTDSCTLR